MLGKPSAHYTTCPGLFSHVLHGRVSVHCREHISQSIPSCRHLDDLATTQDGFHFVQGKVGGPGCGGRGEARCRLWAGCGLRAPKVNDSWRRTRLGVLSGVSGACCRGRYHLCRAGVPGPCPTWGIANTAPIVTPRTRRAAALGAAICARGRLRGGGDAPSRAPFKRCQGLIDEKCPQQVRTCLRRRRRPGSGGCFSGSAAVAGSLPQRRPSGIPGSPKARVGVEAGRGGDPHLLLPSHSLLLPRSTGFEASFRDPVTLAGDTSQVEPYQTRTTSGGSSKDFALPVPRGLSEVLSHPSTSDSFCLLFFSCLLQCWEVQPRASHMLGNCFAPKHYSHPFLIFIERQGPAQVTLAWP